MMVLIIAAVAVALLVVGIIYVFQQAAAKQVAEDALASQVAASSSAAAASEDTERAIRQVYVAELESSIEKDSKARVKKGSLTGPIKRVSCTPTGGGSLDDLTSLTTTFECIAVNETNKDKTESGYVFTATMNWDDASYSWHLGR